MAYYVDFMSFGGTAYRVEIGSTGGTPLPLTGGPEPFLTQEDDGGDLFTPVRLQTGTIRVIDDGSLMADIIPENNTTTKVRLKDSGSTVWEGYLCAAGYSQPWDGHLNMIELPVQSVLSSLYDVSIDTLYLGQLMSFSDIINAGLTSIGYSLHVASTADDCSGAWMSAKVNASVFFSKEEISNQGDSQTAYFGKSYGEIIEDICKLFGLMCRDTGIELLFATYDKPTGFAVGILTNVFTFKSVNNEQGFMQGCRTAKVVLDIDTSPTISVLLPQTVEDQSSVNQVSVYNDGIVYIQPHDIRTGGNENFLFKNYDIAEYYWEPSDMTVLSFTRQSGNATYQQCLRNSVINSPDFYIKDGAIITTGAFPCRWFYQNNAQVVVLNNGLFLNQIPSASHDIILPNTETQDNFIYRISSEGIVYANGGYLNIKMSCHRFIRKALPTSNLYFSSSDLFTGGMEWSMYVAVKFGSYYWNGSSWTTTLSSFPIKFVGNEIASNKTSDINIDSDSGWFIPVTSVMNGNVEIWIEENVYTPTTDGVVADPSRGNRIDIRSAILCNLEVDLFTENVITASYRNNNVYRQQILLSGFSEEKSIGLRIGTFNNNIDSKSFIKSDGTTYIESLSYGGGNQRPEMHLLGRMVSYYDRVRQTLRAKVGTGLGLFDTLYSHGGRVFVGIDAQHNWRDDTQEVEFIEVRTE